MGASRRHSEPKLRLREVSEGSAYETIQSHRNTGFAANAGDLHTGACNTCLLGDCAAGWTQDERTGNYRRITKAQSAGLRVTGYQVARTTSVTRSRCG